MLIALKSGPAGGLVVDDLCFAFAHSLDRRGITMRIEGESLRVVGPGGAKPDLSSTDVEAIKRWKPYLMALTAYVPPDPP